MVDVTTFNVNQFSKPEHQRADLVERMKTSDIVLVQECVDLALIAFARKRGDGWAAFQVRNGDNDGHANTAVLYRTSLGKPTDTAVVSLGRVDGKKADQHTRERFLVAVEFDHRDWYGSFHGFPQRDHTGNPHLIAAVAAWVHTQVKRGKGVTLGADKNQIPPAQLQKATGLKWRGVDIDGFLTNQPMKKVSVFPKGFSDHPGVKAQVTPKAPKGKHKAKRNRVQKARVLLREALRNANSSGKQERAGRIRRALGALVVAAPKPRKTFPAIAKARKQSHNGPRFGAGLCLQRVRICYSIPAVAGDAIGAWNIAATKHRVTDPTKIPRGYPVFWSGGSHGHGHIAISAGDGNVWSTDIRRIGYFDYVPITEIHDKWGLTLLGYTQDLNGRAIA